MKTMGIPDRRIRRVLDGFPAPHIPKNIPKTADVNGLKRKKPDDLSPGFLRFPGVYVL
jgi:hypothetical protein